MGTRVLLWPRMEQRSWSSGLRPTKQSFTNEHIPSEMEPVILKSTFKTEWMARSGGYIVSLLKIKYFPLNNQLKMSEDPLNEQKQIDFLQ